MNSVRRPLQEDTLQQIFRQTSLIESIVLAISMHWHIPEGILVRIDTYTLLVPIYERYFSNTYWNVSIYDDSNG